MEQTENELKKIILQKYGSLKSFAKEIEMPYTTLDSIFKRGFIKASAHNLLKITTKLDIDATALINGKIERSTPKNALVNLPEWQELFILKEQTTVDRKEVIVLLLNKLKDLIKENDELDIFTGIPEEELIYYFELLNASGQEKAVQQVELLTKIQEYRKGTFEAPRIRIPKI